MRGLFLAVAAAQPQGEREDNPRADRNPIKKGTARGASSINTEFSKETQGGTPDTRVTRSNILAVLTAANLNSSKSNVTEEQATMTVKSSKSNSSDREQAPQGADSCNFTIDEAGVKRQGTEAQKQKCEKGAGEARSTIKTTKSNTFRETDGKIKDAVVK